MIQHHATAMSYVLYKPALTTWYQCIHGSVQCGLILLPHPQILLSLPHRTEHIPARKMQRWGPGGLRSGGQGPWGRDWDVQHKTDVLPESMKQRTRMSWLPQGSNRPSTNWNNSPEYSCTAAGGVSFGFVIKLWGVIWDSWITFSNPWFAHHINLLLNYY